MGIVRQSKGKSTLEILENYTVIDLETTGLDPSFDDIIELAAIRVRNGQVAEEYQQLVNPGYKIDSFISNLTGITNQMLASAPSAEDVLQDYLDFIGDDMIVGHNVNFDINFIYDNAKSLCNMHFSNSFVDTLRLSRRLCKDLKHHRLGDMADYFDIKATEKHRALADCQTTYLLYNILKAKQQ